MRFVVTHGHANLVHPLSGRQSRHKIDCEESKLKKALKLPVEWLVAQGSLLLPVALPPVNKVSNSSLDENGPASPHFQSTRGGVWLNEGGPCQKSQRLCHC